MATKATKKQAKRSTPARKDVAPFEQQFSVSEFALAVGVSEQQVYRMTRQGKLHRNDGGFLSLADATNRRYYDAHHKPLALPSLVTPPAAGPLPEPTVSGLPRAEIERRKSLAQLEKLRLANEKAAGSLVERPFVFAFIGSLVATLNNQFLALPQRAAPDLAALARGSESDDAAAVAVEAFLTKEMYSSCKAASAGARKFLASMYQVGTAAGPLPIEQALEDLRGMISVVISEVSNRKESAA